MTGPHALSSTTSYWYAQGLYDFPDREFRGFGQVTETRADGSKVIHYYYQDSAKKGKEYKTQINSALNAPYASTENFWYESILNDVFVTNLSKTDEYTFDGNPNYSTFKKKLYQNYDTFGNPGLVINYGDYDISGDEVYTYDEYWPSCSSVYVVDKLKHRYITSVPDGAKLRENFYWYDNRPDCVDKGNLTKGESWLNTGSFPITTHEYDSYGNRTKTTDPEGRITQTIFDSTYHTFPVQTINAKNQTSTKSFNAVNGQPTQETDPNGYTTSYAYDTFQRKIKEIKPYDTDAFPTTFFQYLIDGVPPESVIVSKRETSGGSGTLDTIQFIDGFGNLIQTKSEWLDFSNRIAVDVFYDEMGRVKKQSNPYLTDNSTGYSTPNLSAPNTSYDYDTLGRPVLIHNPDGTQVSRVFDHWSVTETDENGHAKSYTFDAFQRLKQVTENNQGASYITSYLYSPLGELTKITDHLGNITTINYDSLGRKTSMVDPDMGIWNYGYDRVGNLVSQTDARGITTHIHYDPLNRKTLIDYPNSTDIQLTYDTGTIGTLPQVIDSAGTANYQYDQRLRKIQENRSLDGHVWTTNWTYDAMDRVASMTYPNGQNVAFNYNAMGKLSSIPGVTNGISYNANGQQTEKIFPNGETTLYSYHDANLRLNKITTSGIQDFTYTYDNVGNVKSIADGIAGKTENFTYDDLDRLTRAGDSGYDIGYQYNAIGNLTSTTNATYTYGEGIAGPHALIGMTVPRPVVGSFILDNGNSSTTENAVTLNNVSYGNPTHYMASEDKLFTGALWLPYSTAPTFILSAGLGIKTVYFKVMNADGESNTVSDSIELLPPPPTIGYSPTSFGFTATQGGSNPPSQTLNISNAGGGTLNWSASDNATWLSLSPSSGTGNETVTISVNISGLTANTYKGTITITASGATNSPVNIPVTLNINTPPGILSITPLDGLISSGNQGGPFTPSSEDYTLQNIGGSSLNWTASKGQEWVSLSSTGGTLAAGSSTTVTVSINSNANNLATGFYFGSVDFMNATSGTGGTIGVILHVTELSSVIYVEPNGICGGKHPCYSSIQSAINAAGEEATIKVAQGTYYENIGVSNNISIEGGWDSNFIIRSNDPTLTLIDGGGTSSVFDLGACNTIIEGFTLTNGGGVNLFGGAIRAKSSQDGSLDLTLINNIIANNTAKHGGGIFVGAYGGSPATVTLKNNIIKANSAQNYGGGIFITSSQQGNTVITLENNLIAGNIASYSGGIWLQTEQDNCLASLISTNNTITNNTASSYYSGGISSYSSGTGSSINITMTNDILWGNSASSAGKDLFIGQGAGGVCTSAITYSDIGDTYGSYSGDGTNMNTDPFFVDPASGDYHLSSSSPLIDAGTNTGAPLTDFEGDIRPLDGDGDGVAKTDIGADEYKNAVTLFKPNGGKVIPSGSNYTITWVAPIETVKFKLLYSADNGLTWTPITADFVEGTSYDWSVPKPLGNKKTCLIKVIGYDVHNVKVGADKSDAPFTIEVIKLESPNGGAGVKYTSGDYPLPITWTTNGTKKPVAKVKLYYTKDAGLTWIPITTFTGSNPGTFDWTVPTVKAQRNQCKVRVVLLDALGNILAADASDSYFTIKP